jgi:hypothetical protein
VVSARVRFQDVGGDVPDDVVVAGEVGVVRGGRVTVVVRGVRIVVAGAIVVDAGGVLSVDPPLTATTAMMTATTTTIAPTASTIHLPRPFFCGR